VDRHIRRPEWRRFVEYRRATDRGLVNQGWKDSFDGINRGRRTLAAPPIALAEVQACVYAAYTARVELADALSDQARAPALAEAGGGPEGGVQRAVWMPLRQADAVALDGAGDQVDAVTSNMGHCLWCGYIDEARAPAVARHLLGPRLWTGFGVRTLADAMGAYNRGELPQRFGVAARQRDRRRRPGPLRIPVGGPADRRRAARRGRQHRPAVARTVLWFDRAEFDSPVPYPTSCAPQAWAAAAPLLLVRNLLGLNPDVPAGSCGWLPRYRNTRCRCGSNGSD